MIVRGTLFVALLSPASLGSRCGVKPPGRADSFRKHGSDDLVFDTLPPRFRELAGRCSEDMQLAAGLISAIERADADMGTDADLHTQAVPHPRCRPSDALATAPRGVCRGASRSSSRLNRKNPSVRRKDVPVRGRSSSRRRFPDALLRWMPHVQVRGRPLQNIDSTGYMNAVLQVLTHTPPIANYCLGRGHSSTCSHVGFCALCLVEVR